MDLGNDEIRRYARHLLLPEVGVEGQKKLRAASVLCLGAGGLGSPAAMYLAAAGVGRLGLVDFDLVDLSNLQRQLLHGTADVGRPKVESARETLRRLNPGVDVVAHTARLTRANALELVAGYDVVVDGTDNFPARYLASDACVLRRKPYVYGAIFRWEGQASLFAPHLGGPCYRCLFPEPPPAGSVPSCAEAGVFGVLPGVIGCLQATEALKLLLGLGSPLLGRLLLFDALGMNFREVKLKRDPACPLCGERPTIQSLIDYDPVCAANAAANPPGPLPEDDEVSVQDMKRALEDPSLGIIVLDVREPAEWAIARVAGVRPLALSELPQRLGELDPSRAYYLHCKSGVRSLKAAGLLKSRGFARVKSVRGGILAWAAEVDPTLPTY